MPLRCRFITGITAWVNRKVPSRLKAISFCQSAKVSSSVVACGLAITVLPPTALTRMSMRPWSRATSATSRVDLRRVQRVDQLALDLAARLAAGLAQRRHRLVQAALVIVDGDHRRAFARHDRGGGAADAVRRGA